MRNQSTTSAITVKMPTALRFGKWTIIRYDEAETRSYCTARCDCGRIKRLRLLALLSGNSTQCGCCRGANIGAFHMTHGMTKTKEYSIWGNMKTRCYNPKARGYPVYGGAGIGICYRWRKSFAAFIEDMGRLPTQEHSIDRIDNAYGYNCGKCDECLRAGHALNCRWATPAEQARNTSQNQWLTYEGETLCHRDWEIRYGLPSACLGHRLQMGWDVREALETPIGGRRRRHWPRKNNRMVEHDGQRLCVTEWANKTGLSSALIHYRLKHGWTPEAALTTPAGGSLLAHGANGCADRGSGSDAHAETPGAFHHKLVGKSRLE